MKTAASVCLISAVLMLSACGQQSATTDKTPKGAKGKADNAANIPAAVGEQLGTPMAERIATISLLNKRNGQTRDFELKPGESVRFGKVALFLRACERTAPWETYPDQGAFVRMAVLEAVSVHLPGAGGKSK